MRRWRRVSCCLMAALAPLKRRGWVVGGSLEQVFQVQVDSHTPPPRRGNDIQRHTQQTGWRSPSLQPLLGTPLPSAPPFSCLRVIEERGTHGRSVISVHVGSACGFGGLIPQSCCGMSNICSELRPHQWRPLFHHQSWGMSLCVLLFLSDNPTTAFD